MCEFWYAYVDQDMRASGTQGEIITSFYDTLADFSNFVNFGALYWRK